MALGAALFFVISALPAWLAFSGLRNGVIWARGGSYSRSEQPVLFWIVFACMPSQSDTSGSWPRALRWP